MIFEKCLKVTNQALSALQNTTGISTTWTGHRIVFGNPASSAHIIFPVQDSGLKVTNQHHLSSKYIFIKKTMQ
jgi:hypothetical protein